MAFLETSRWNVPSTDLCLSALSNFIIHFSLEPDRHPLVAASSSRVSMSKSSPPGTAPAAVVAATPSSLVVPLASSTRLLQAARVPSSSPPTRLSDIWFEEMPAEEQARLGVRDRLPTTDDLDVRVHILGMKLSGQEHKRCM